ncbi:hypothetical protein HGM15179_010393 [Zosterops borbonicus]|uniref:Uncharacterized protein n=1 Tax=Zosterops borbonicus TaxID=364589 RepID=A0A8K1LJY2_9PASS|nr:hypothetical protein HGM15179_010393 [Zosterops borbonicus]
MRDAMLDLVLTNKQELVGNVELKGSLGCIDNKMVEFKILSSRSSKLTTLGFSREDFGLFGDPLGGTAWDRAVEGLRTP